MILSILIEILKKINNANIFFPENNKKLDRINSDLTYLSPQFIKFSTNFSFLNHGNSNKNVSLNKY